jgi:hypothetical protein
MLLEYLEAKFYELYFYYTDIKFNFQSLPDEKKFEIVINGLLILFCLLIFVCLFYFIFLQGM